MQSFIYQDFEIANKAAGVISIPADIFVATNLEILGEEKEALSVKAVRELIKKIAYEPFGETRVIIIPNADKMLIPAQNALLKTLEEPPEHTLFFLIAQNPHAMLDTILSRCEIKYSDDVKANDCADNEYAKNIKPVLNNNHTKMDEYRVICFLQEKSAEKEKAILELEKLLGNTEYQKRLGEARRKLKFNANWNIICKYIIQGKK